MPVSGTVMIDELGIVGDAICNRKHHGGVDQAIYLEGLTTLAWWEAELANPILPGTFGENLVISDLDNRTINVGDQLLIGDVLLEATSARIPCATFVARMNDPQFARRYIRAARPGIYCRVLKSGTATADDTVVYRPFEGEKVTIAETMATFGKTLPAEERRRYLAAPIHYKLRASIEAAGDIEGQPASF
jgi:MOSC domain-containing protein YiiM